MDTINDKLANAVLDSAQIKERDLMRKADHASDIGTFMSLGSSALFFIESALIKDRKMPKPMYAVALTGITTGMGAVIYAIKLRRDASKIAHQSDESLLKEIDSVRARPAVTASIPSTWVEKQNPQQNNPNTLAR